MYQSQHSLFAAYPAVIRAGSGAVLGRLSRARPAELFSVALVVLTLFSVCFAAAYFHAKPGFKGSETYSQIAADFLTTGTFHTTYRPPVYPLVLAALMRLEQAGALNWERAAIALNVCLSIATGALLMAVTWRLTRKKQHAAAALFLYSAHLMLQMELLTKRETALFLFLQLTFMLAWTLPRHGKHGGILRGILRPALLGLILGLLHLTRPTGILFTAAAVLLECFHPATSLRRRAGTTAILVLFFMLVSAPWIAATQRISGKLSLASSHNLGQGLYKGHNPAFTVIFPWVDVDALEPAMIKLAGGKSLQEPETDPFFRKQAWDYVSQHPWQCVVVNSLLKIGIFISPFPAPFGSGQLEEANGSISMSSFEWRNIPAGAVCAAYMLVLWFGTLYGFKYFSGEARRAVRVIAILFFLHLALCCLTYSEMRYRLPMDVLFMIIAAPALSSLAGRFFKSSRFKDLPGVGTKA